MMTISSLGSEYQEVPRPPSQPYRPGTAAMSSRLVTTDTPNPQPLPSKNPELRLDAAFCSGVSWSVVMSSTDSLDRIRELSCLRSEEHTSELQSHLNLVCRLLLEKKKHRQPTSARQR